MMVRCMALNFRHLHYFWMIARDGSIAAASRSLDLSPQTLSGQLANLEQSLGGSLFRREGRRLVLSSLGQAIYPHAEDMFRAAHALEQVAEAAREQRLVLLNAGIVSSIHKLLAYRLLEPALILGDALKLRCQSGRMQALVDDLLAQRLDIVLSDTPPPPDARSRLLSLQIESSSISLFAPETLAERLRRQFPLSLHDQPLLVSNRESAWFGPLMNWFEAQGIQPRLRAEVDDSALVKIFGSHGMGAFVAPTIIREEVERQYGVVHVGSLQGVEEHLFALVRKHYRQHPALELICHPPTRL